MTIKRALVGLGLVGVLFLAIYLMQLLLEATADPIPTPPSVLQWSPQLAAPTDGLQTYPTNITLEWTWPALEAHQLYSVRLWREGQAPGDIAWTGDSQLGISGFLESNPPGRFYWQVAVIQLDEQGNFVGMASGWSPVGQFERIPPTAIPTLVPSPIPTATLDPRFTEVNPYNTPPNDPATLIELPDSAALRAKRQVLRDRLWGPGGYPRHKQPTFIRRNLIGTQFDGLSNLRQVDQLTIQMELGIQSKPFLLHPIHSNGRFIIYHQGSEGEFEPITTFPIDALLQEGYTVMAFSMPMLGANNRPIVEIPHLGRVRLTGYLHFHMIYIEPLIQEGVALKLFIEPVIVGLNYAHQLGFEHYFMLGISGGGWTTHLVAALDTRIERSYPVAGSIPEYQRWDGHAAFTDLMAYVQPLPGVFPLVNYLELYVLGGYGAGRKQLMVVNQFDRCCFWGVRYLDWYPTVQARLEALGRGEFEVFLDSTHTEHLISPAALQYILADLASVSN
jgi:hypothetical protein